MSHDSGNSRTSSVYSSHTMGGTALSATLSSGLRTRHLKLLHPFFMSVDTTYPALFTSLRVAAELCQWSALLLVPTFTAIDAPWGNLAWGPIMSSIAIPFHYAILPLWEGNNVYGRINNYAYYSIISWSCIALVALAAAAMGAKIFMAAREFTRSAAMRGAIHFVHFLTTAAFQPLMHVFLALMVCDNRSRIYSSSSGNYGAAESPMGVLSAFRRIVTVPRGVSNSIINSNGGGQLPPHTFTLASSGDVFASPTAPLFAVSDAVSCLADPYPTVLFTFSLVALAILVLGRATLQLFVTDPIPKSTYILARANGTFDMLRLGLNLLLVVLYHYLLLGTGQRIVYTSLFAAGSLILSGAVAFYLPYFCQRMNQLMCGFFLTLAFWAIQQCITVTDAVLKSAVHGPDASIEEVASSSSSSFLETIILRRGTASTAYYYIFHNWDAVVALVGGALAFILGYAWLANCRISRDWRECVRLATDGVPPMPLDMDPSFVFPAFLPEYEVHPHRAIERRMLAEERFRRTKEAHVALQKERIRRDQQQQRESHSAAAAAAAEAEAAAREREHQKDTQRLQSSLKKAFGGGGGGSKRRGGYGAEPDRLPRTSTMLGGGGGGSAAQLSRRQLEAHLAWASDSSRVHSAKLHSDQTRAEALWIAYPFLSSVLVVSDVEVAVRGTTDFLKKTGLWPPVVMLAFAVRIYTKGMAKFVWSHWLELQFATFLAAFVPSMNATALGIVEGLTKKDLTYWELYEAQRRMGQIGQSLLIRDNATKRAFASAQKLHREALHSMRAFWDRLLGDHVDMARLGALAKVITDRRAEGFAQYLRVQSDTSDQQSMLRFAQFLEQVMIDHTSAQACRDVLIEGLESERIANGGMPIDVGGGGEGDGAEGGEDGVGGDEPPATSNAARIRDRNRRRRESAAADSKNNNKNSSGFDDDESAFANGGRIGGGSGKEESKTIASLRFNINMIMLLLAGIVIALLACGLVMDRDRQQSIDRVEIGGAARHLSQEVAALVARIADPLTDADAIPTVRQTLQRRLSMLRDRISDLAFGEHRSSAAAVQTLYSLPFTALRYATAGGGSSSATVSTSSSAAAAAAAADDTSNSGNSGNFNGGIASASLAGGGPSSHSAGGLLQTTSSLVAAVEAFLRSLDMVLGADVGASWTAAGASSSTSDDSSTDALSAPASGNSLSSLQDLEASAALQMLIASLNAAEDGSIPFASSSSSSSSSSSTSSTNGAASTAQISADRNRAIALEMRALATTFVRTNAWLSIASAFNHSVTTYVEEGRDVLRRTQYITTALFLCAILVIIVVNFVIVFNLKKISTTKLSTLGLFTLIPRSALGRLSSEVSGWIDRFDEPDEAFQQMKAERGLEDDDDARRRMLEDDPALQQQQQQQQPNNNSSNNHHGANHNTMMMGMGMGMMSPMMMGGGYQQQHYSAGGGDRFEHGMNGGAHPHPSSSSFFMHHGDGTANHYAQQQQQQQQNFMTASIRGGGGNGMGVGSPNRFHGDDANNNGMLSRSLHSSRGTPLLGASAAAGADASGGFGGAAAIDDEDEAAAGDGIADDKLYNRLILRGDLATADTGGHHHHGHSTSASGTPAAIAAETSVNGQLMLPPHAGASGSSHGRHPSASGMGVSSPGRGGGLPDQSGNFGIGRHAHQQHGSPAGVMGRQQQHLAYSNNFNPYQQQQMRYGGYGGSPQNFAGGRSGGAAMMGSAVGMGMSMGGNVTYYNGFGYDEDAVIDADLKTIEESVARYNSGRNNGNGNRKNSAGGDPRKNSANSDSHNSDRRNSSADYYNSNSGDNAPFGGDDGDEDMLLEMQLFAASAAAGGGGGGKGRRGGGGPYSPTGPSYGDSSFYGGRRRSSTSVAYASSFSSYSRRRGGGGAFASVTSFFSARFGGGGRQRSRNGGDSRWDGDSGSSGGGGADGYVDAGAIVFRYISQPTCDLIIALLTGAAVLTAVALVALFAVTMAGTEANLEEIQSCEVTLERTVQMIDARREAHRLAERFVMRVGAEDLKDVTAAQEARRYDLYAAELRSDLQHLQSSNTAAARQTARALSSSSEASSVSSSMSSSNAASATDNSGAASSAAAVSTYISHLIDVHEDLWSRVNTMQNAAKVLACSTNSVALDCEHFPVVSWDRRQFVAAGTVDTAVTEINTFLNPKIATAPPTGTQRPSTAPTIPRAPEFITVDNYSYWLPRNESYDMRTLTANRRLATARAALANPLYFESYQRSLVPLFDALSVMAARGGAALVSGSAAMKRLEEAAIALSGLLGILSLVAFGLLRFSAGTFRYTRHALSGTVLFSIACIVLGAVGITYLPTINNEGSVMIHVISLWNESIAANDDLLSHARRAAFFNDRRALAAFGDRMAGRDEDTLWGEFAGTMSDEVTDEVEMCVINSRNAFFVEAIAVAVAANLFNVSRVPPIVNAFVWNASADVNSVRYVLENPTQKMFSDRPRDLYNRTAADKRELVRELLLGPIRRTSFERSNSACRRAVERTRVAKADAVRHSYKVLHGLLIACLVLSSASIVLLLIFIADIVRFRYDAISAGVVKARDDRVVGGDDSLFLIMTRRSRLALVILALLFTALFLFNILEIENALPSGPNQNLASLREFEVYRSLALSTSNNENRSTYRAMAEASGAASMDAAHRFYQGSWEVPLPTTPRAVVGRDDVLDERLFGGILGVPASFQCTVGYGSSSSSSAANGNGGDDVDDATTRRGALSYTTDDVARATASVTTAAGITVSVLPSWSSTVPTLLRRGVDLAQRRWRDEVVALSRGRHTAASAMMLTSLHDAADALGPALHETTQRYAERARREARAGLIGYMVIWAIIVLALVYAYAFVFRPVLEQLIREEEGTRVMLKMIPADVRDRVPAIAEYLESGIVVQDVKVHEINEAAIDLSTVPTVSIDFDGTILAFSKAAEQCFFWTKEEAIGKNVRMLMPDDIAVEHDSYLATYRRTGVKHIIGNVLKTRAMRRNGATFPAEIAVKEIHRGRSTTFIGTIRDVSKDMEVEKAMAVSTAISDAAAIPIVVIDKAGIILRFNNAARQTFRTEGSMVGRSVNMLMPPNIAAMHDSYMAKYAMLQVKNVIDKSRMMQAVRVNSGELFPIRITVKELKGAEGGAVVGTNRDVQFIGYVEDLTRQVGLRLATTISDAIPITSPVPYVETNSDGVIITFSPAAEQLFGYTAQEARGRNISMLMPPDMAARHDGFIRTFHATGRKRMLDATTLQYATKRADDGKRLITFPVRISVREISDAPTGRNQSTPAGAGGAVNGPAGGGAVGAAAAVVAGAAMLQNPSGAGGPLSAGDRHQMAMSGNMGAASLLLGGSGNNPNAAGGNPNSTSAAAAAAAAAANSDATGIGGILSAAAAHGTSTSRFVAFIEDISDARHLEKENVVTSRLTDISPTPMIITDVYGTIIRFPPAAEKAFGYSAAEAVGKDATKLLGPTDYQFIPEAFRHPDHNNRLLLSAQAARRVLVRPRHGKSFYTEMTIKLVAGGSYYMPPPPPPVQLTFATSGGGGGGGGSRGSSKPQQGSGGAQPPNITSPTSAGTATGAFMEALLGDMRMAGVGMTSSGDPLQSTASASINANNNSAAAATASNTAATALMRQYRAQVQQHVQTQNHRQFQQIRLVAIFRTALQDQLDAPHLAAAGAASSVYTEAISKLATTPLVWIDSRGTILGCSESTIERFQWARDELIGQNVSLLMPDSIASRHDEYLFNYRQRLALKGREEAARNSPVIGKERKVLAKTRDEQVFNATLLVKDIHIGSLEPVFVGYIRDLTSEMELATQKHLSATIIQSSFIPIICIDQNGAITEFSSAAQHVFGYSREEMVDQRANVKILMPDHIAKSHDGYLKAYAKTRIKAIIDSKRPVTALRRDKTEFQAELMVKEIVHKDIFGKDITEYIGYVKDLSHQTILDQATRINELVASLSAVPIIIINPRGVIVECNAATEKDFGYQLGELAGKNVKVLMPDDVAIEHDTYLSRYRATRVKTVIDNTRVVRALRKDRSTFPAELSVREVRKADGSEGQFIGYVRDVTVEQQIAATNYINTTMMDLSPVPVLVVDHVGSVQHFSRAASQTFGYAVSAVIGQNVKMLMPQEIADQHDMYLSRYLVTRKPHVIGSTRRVTAKKADGKLFPVELNIREVFDEHLRVPVYVGFVHDLSEQAEIEALNAFSEMVNVLSPVPVISINHEGTVIRFSASAEQEFKVSASEIIGKNVKLLQPPEVAEHHDMYLQRYQETKVKHVIDNTRATVAKRWDNSTFRVSLYVKEVTDSDHEFPLFVGYIKNIEEDNRIEEASKENAAMQLLAPLPVFVITRNGIVLDVNPAVEAVFGYHQSEVKGQNISIIMPPHIASQHDEYLRRYHRTGVKNVIDQIRGTQGMRKDGTVIPIEISIREVSVPGMEIQYVGYVKDTSMSQRMVESLRWNEAIISLAATPLVVIDPDGLIMKFTLEAEKLFMYNADEVIGKNVKMLMPPEIARKHDRYIEKYHITRIKTVIDHNRRVKGRKKNGEVFSCELGVREILNEDDAMTEAFAGYIRPIATDHSSMIEGSSEINGMMHAVSLHGVIIIDELGIIEKANPAVAGMFGVQEATIIGKNVKMLMPPEIAQSHDQYLANYLLTGVKKIIDKKRITYGMNVATGAVFPMELSVKELNDVKVPQGGGTTAAAAVSANAKNNDAGGGGLNSASANNTAAAAADAAAAAAAASTDTVPTRRRYLGCVRMIEHEIQIERQRTLNKHTLDLSMSGTIVSNHRGNIIMFSHVAEMLFGCSSDQVVGRVGLADLMPQLAQQLDGALDFLGAYRRAVASASNQQHLLQRNQHFAHQMNALNQQQQQQALQLQQQGQGGGGPAFVPITAAATAGAPNDHYADFNVNASFGPQQPGGGPMGIGMGQNAAAMMALGHHGGYGGQQHQYPSFGGGQQPQQQPVGGGQVAMGPNGQLVSQHSMAGAPAGGANGGGGGGVAPGAALTSTYISRTVSARRVDNGAEITVNIFIRELYFKTVPGAEPHFVTYVDPIAPEGGGQSQQRGGRQVGGGGGGSSAGGGGGGDVGSGTAAAGAYFGAAPTGMGGFGPNGLL